MSFNRDSLFRILPVIALFLAAHGAYGQSGNAGTVRGTLTDPSAPSFPMWLSI